MKTKKQVILYGQISTDSIQRLKSLINWNYLKWYEKLYLYIRYKPLDLFRKVKIYYGNEVLTFRNGKLIKTVKDEIIRGKRASLTILDDCSDIDLNLVSEVLKKAKEGD